MEMSTATKRPAVKMTISSDSRSSPASLLLYWSLLLVLAMCVCAAVRTKTFLRRLFFPKRECP